MLCHKKPKAYNPSTMRRLKQSLSAVLAALFAVGTMLVILPQNAGATSDPSLVISQLKITSSNGQFITLYNPTNSTLDMTKVQLQYFNNYDLTKATSSRLIALAGSLSPHGYYTLSDDDLVMCYRMIVDSVSLGFSSTAGMVQIVQLTQGASGGSVSPVPIDNVSWSKTTAVGAQTLPASTSSWLQRRPIDSSGNPKISASGTGNWVAVQQDTNDPCNIVITGTSTSSSLANNLLLPPTQPPITIINLTSYQSSSVLSDSNLPEADKGLMMPIINELLPNPVGSGNDSSAEFIELYNPNPLSFDLSGFTLQTGLTSFHNYKFSGGELLAPLSFTAFYSSKTGLSLSNSGGQARLLDPNGNILNQSQEYGSAKDGASWSYANGKWLWTSDITPGLANIIRNNPIITNSIKSKTSKSTTQKSLLKKATKTKTKKTKTKKAKKKTVQPSPGAFENTAQKTSVNWHFLAAVITLAVIYVAYEYRLEISNRFRRIRGN